MDDDLRSTIVDKNDEDLRKSIVHENKKPITERPTSRGERYEFALYDGTIIELKNEKDLKSLKRHCQVRREQMEQNSYKEYMDIKRFGRISLMLGKIQNELIAIDMTKELTPKEKADESYKEIQKTSEMNERLRELGIRTPN